MSNKFVLANHRKCIGCGTCMAACMMEHPPIDGVPIPRLTLVKTRRVSTPIGCHHCIDAPCAAACPEGALVIINETVQANQDKCIGCRSCVLACPYGAIDIVPVTKTLNIGNLTIKVGERPYILKCDLCKERAAGPACIEACLTSGIALVDSELIEASTKKKQHAAAVSAELYADVV
jgi:electron transport protein HydN